MAYALGIDLGTTFSAAAIAFDDGRVELVHLGGRSATIPSVVLARDTGDVVAGARLRSRARSWTRPASLASSSAVSATRRR